MDNRTVFECKVSESVLHLGIDNEGLHVQYEIDSLCGLLKLSRSYFQQTNDSSFMNENCTHSAPPKCCRNDLNQGYSAIDQIFRVIEEQSQASWDEDRRFISYYNWTGTPGVSLSPLVNNDGNGEPKGYTGMVGTHHRPSDDLSMFGSYSRLPGCNFKT